MAKSVQSGNPAKSPSSPRPRSVSREPTEIRLLREFVLVPENEYAGYSLNLRQCARKFLAAWDRKTIDALVGTKPARQFPQSSAVRVLTPARLNILRRVANRPTTATAERIAEDFGRSIGSVRAALNRLWKARFVKPVGAANWRVTETGRAALVVEPLQPVAHKPRKRLAWDT